MAIYFGSEKISFNSPVTIGVRCARGTVTSDANAIITFPELDFTPSVITIWNVERVDHSTDPEYEEGYVRYTHEGFLLTAVYTDNTWISQIAGSQSGDVAISNESYEAGDVNGFDKDTESPTSIYFDGSQYHYQLYRYHMIDALANKEFHYAIFG